KLMNSSGGSRENFVGRNHCTAALPLPARDERGEGRAGRGTGRGDVRTEIDRISPLPDPLPTPSSWGEGNISGSLMVAVSKRPRGPARFFFTCALCLEV